MFLQTNIFRILINSNDYSISFLMWVIEEKEGQKTYTYLVSCQVYDIRIKALMKGREN